MSKYPLTTAIRRFSNISISIHWISVLLILFAIVLGLLRPLFEDNGWDELALTLHRQLGLAVLLLLACRLFFRMSTLKIDKKSTTVSPFIYWSGFLSHVFLYSLLIALPILGWAMTNAQGHTVHFLGILNLPNILTVDPDWADTFQEWHELAGNVLMAVVALHAAAALFHHYVLKDEVLVGMLPNLGRRNDNNSNT